MSKGICTDHECVLCDQSQKLLEAMNEKCVQYERVIEAAKALAKLREFRFLYMGYEEVQALIKLREAVDALQELKNE